MTEFKSILHMHTYHMCVAYHYLLPSTLVMQ